MGRIVVLVFLCALGGPARAQVADGSVGGDPIPAAGTRPAAADHRFYLGADYTQARLSVSRNTGGIPGDDYDAHFVDLRAGYRIFDSLGGEFHYGVPTQGTGNPGNVEASHYYAIFVVPTATLFERVELGFPIGYAFSRVSHRESGGSREHANLDSLAFGLNLEVPVTQFWNGLPDLRLTAGAVMYDDKSSERFYGYHFGVRYSFGL